MSFNHKIAPIFSYPGGMPVDISTLPSDDDFTKINYKFVSQYTGSEYLLDGPLYIGTQTFDNIKKQHVTIHGGAMTVSKNGTIVIEYH